MRLIWGLYVLGACGAPPSPSETLRYGHITLSAETFLFGATLAFKKRRTFRTGLFPSCFKETKF
jgi:hypothetical protein